MVRHDIPVGAFFTGSPELCITILPIQAKVPEAVVWAHKHGDKGDQRNCSTYLNHDKERDGYLILF